MKIAVIGTGYVGLVSGACFAHIGHEVVCIDREAGKIAKLKNGDIPIYEPGLLELVKSGVGASRLSFSNSIEKTLADGVEAVLLAVGTPTDEKTGRADLSHVFAAAKEVAQSLVNPAVIITKSTVPVGTGKKILEILRQERPELNLEVASNPEFLREGSAIDDFLFPDRVIIGAESGRTQAVMQGLYNKMIGEGVPILFTNIATAELIKYASNAFLAMKIAFANEIADICEGTGGEMAMVMKGMGMDKRIGVKHMNPGPGYGGSCFPKDTKALVHIANDAGYPTKIIESVITSNDSRKKRMAAKIIDAAGGSVKGIRIAVLGLTFKAGTDDMRESPSLVIVPELLKAGAEIAVHDPVGMSEAKKHLHHEDIAWCKSADDALRNADIMAIVTEWPQYASLEPQKMKTLMRGNIIVDLRNIFDFKKTAVCGFKYFAVGRTDFQ